MVAILIWEKTGIEPGPPECYSNRPIDAIIMTPEGSGFVVFLKTSRTRFLVLTGGSLRLVTW